MWCIYVIQNNETRELYFGLTKDLKRRINEHNLGKQISTKRAKGKWILVYAEAYRSKEDAVKRELMLKHHGSAKQKLKSRIQGSLI